MCAHVWGMPGKRRKKKTKTFPSHRIIIPVNVWLDFSNLVIAGMFQRHNIFSIPQRPPGCSACSSSLTKKKKNKLKKILDSLFLSKAVCAERCCNTTPAPNERKGGKIQKEGVNPTRVSQVGEYVETPGNPVRFISELPATANLCKPPSWPHWEIMILAHRHSSDSLRAAI